MFSQMLTQIYNTLPISLHCLFFFSLIFFSCGIIEHFFLIYINASFQSYVCICVYVILICLNRVLHVALYVSSFVSYRRKILKIKIIFRTFLFFKDYSFLSANLLAVSLNFSTNSSLLFFFLCTLYEI